MIIYIKHMVSSRCKLSVAEVLNSLGLKYTTIDLGYVELQQDLNPVLHDELKASLAKSGLELLDDKRFILIERIKNVITKMIHDTDDLPRVNFSTFLSEQLKHDYTYLSNIFTEGVGMNIQHFIIEHKIEKAKELIIDDELSLTEIAYRLHYSSVAHFSTQFKKVTGVTPTAYKKLKDKQRRNLEDV
ncbi:MAG: HTH-type transcriptional activator RhaR [Bacteroidota bacterium]